MTCFKAKHDAIIVGGGGGIHFLKKCLIMQYFKICSYLKSFKITKNERIKIYISYTRCTFIVKDYNHVYTQMYMQTIVHYICIKLYINYYQIIKYL